MQMILVVDHKKSQMNIAVIWHYVIAL